MFNKPNFVIGKVSQMTYKITLGIQRRVLYTSGGKKVTYKKVLTITSLDTQY